MWGFIRSYLSLLSKYDFNIRELGVKNESDRKNQRESIQKDP